MSVSRGSGIFAAVASLFLSSCSLLSGPSQPRFRTQEDVGTVQVGVQSVAPFEDYISSLEPQFELKPQEALDRAIAQTQVEDSALVNQFLTTLQLALPQITHSKTTSLTNDGSKTTDTSTESHSTLPGTTTASTAPAVATPTTTVTLPTTATVDIDAALRYRAATALAQEVSLLNHYVRDAAVRTGTKPYIVRLLVTVMPSVRDEPYDAYTTISFFTGEAKDQFPVRSTLYDTVQKYQFREERGPDGKERIVPHLRSDSEYETYLAGLKTTCTNDAVTVIPLLVTDDLESSLHTNALQRIRDIAVALQGTLSNIGISSGNRIHTEDLDKTLSRNLNSIYALGQPAPNAVLARLGAVYANGRYVAVPRTYGVTVLVLAKTRAKLEPNSGVGDEVIPCPQITFTAITQMHDANGRGFVPPRTREATIRELMELRKSHGKVIDENNADKLLQTVATGNFVATMDALDWSDALWVSQRSGHSSGEFVVSIPRVSLPSNRDHFSLIDDGTTTTLMINHGANLLPDRLHANIKAQFSDTSLFNNGWIFLINTDIKVGGYGRSATFTFPSLNKLIEANAPKGDADAKPGAAETKGRLAAASTGNTASGGTSTKPPVLKHVYAEVTYGRSLSSWTAQTKSPELYWYPMTLVDRDKYPDAKEYCIDQASDSLLGEALKHEIISECELPISYVVTKKEDKKTPKAGFTVAVPAAVIADVDGAGKMLVEVRNADPTDKKDVDVHLQILEGAFIDKDSEPPREGANHDGADHVAKAGAWLLNLHGLRPGTPIVLHAFRLEGKDEVAVDDTIIQVLPATPKNEKPKDEPTKKN